MGTSLRCYIPSFLEFGPLVPEIFEGFLSYMGHRVWQSSWSSDPDAGNKLSPPPLPKEVPKHMALFGQVVLENKMTENCEGMTTTDHRYTISSPSEPAAQVS